MRVLDLFSGIGGFALAGQWVWGDDHEIVGFCEIDKYCHNVLNKNFPGVPIYEDIQQLNGKDFNDIDLITGGFPCQDISVAGKGAGIEEGTRSGLWFEMLRIISEVRPRFALIENVPMLTIRGGTRVIADLTKIGYDAEWTIIGADDVGAWHKRKRIWIVSYPQSKGSLSPRKPKENISKSKRLVKNKKEIGSEVRSNFTRCDKQNKKSEDELSNSNNKRSQRMVKRSQESRRSNKQTRLQSRAREGSRGNTKQRVGGVANGLSDRLDRYWIREPEGIPRVRTGQTKRVQRLKGLGNAIVPQVAYKVMKMIKECDE